MELTGAWRVGVARAREGGAMAWDTRSRTFCMAPTLMGTCSTEAQQVCTIRRPLPEAPARAPIKALNRGPYPVACSAGTWALLQRPPSGHQPWCNTQCVTSIAIGGSSSTGCVWYGLLRANVVCPHAQGAGRISCTVVGGNSV